MGTLHRLGTQGHGAVPEYMARHQRALQNPRGAERAVTLLRSGLLQYAVEYGARYEGCQLGEDGILGDAWLQLAKGYIGLLNGETGRLDCGTLDGEVRRWALQHGFSQQEADEL